MQPAGALRGEHRLLRRLVADQPVVAPGRRPGMRPFELFQLRRIGAGLGAGHQEPSLSVTTRVMALAMVSMSRVEAIPAQRLVSLLAISSKPLRTRSWKSRGRLSYRVSVPRRSASRTRPISTG